MDRDPIAIIGIGCRFPGAYGPEAFWELLRDGIDAITPLPQHRLELALPFYSNPENIQKRNIPWGGFLEKIDQFDPSFFGISPREAIYMDPQQRLLLETTWEALEHAGQIPEDLAGSPTGVFIGISSDDYSDLLGPYSQNEMSQASDALYRTTGTNHAIAANRISYVFDFRGPSVALDSACSSSLVATHLACQSLWSGETTLALAGGIELLLSHQVTETLAHAGFLAADHHCKTFDTQADGYVRGEGIGIVVLKSLAKALSDGDPILAVIRGTAVNQDGRSNGLTAPNPAAQVALLRNAYNQSGVSPGNMQYIEAHGTGTKLGDPIEIKALSSVLSKDRPIDQPCKVGSVKTNIGHLESAAGIAGLIKVALSLKFKQIPPSLHFQEPNPYIRFDQLPLRVQETLEPWPKSIYPALAAVSSFGFGGTNAHAILEEAPARLSSGETRPWQLLILSGKSQKALDAITYQLAHHLTKIRDQPLADVAYSLALGRKAFEWRRILVCRAVEDVITAVQKSGEPPTLPSLRVSKKSPVIFMFTGQGAQYVNMGRDLYQHEPLFKETVDRCSDQLAPHLELDMRHILYPQEAQKEDMTKLIHQTQFTQPALFVIEYALARLLMSWGVHPQAMIGHSIGEFVAACLANVISLEDALGLVAMRGRLMQQMPNGAMLAIRLTEAEILPLLGETLSLAAVNAPTQCTVSGTNAEIETLQQKLIEEGVGCQRLQTSHAFHSSMMDPILHSITDYVAEIQLKTPMIPFISNVTGDWVTKNEICTPQYWANQLRHTVRYSQGLAKLCQEPQTIFLEIGPGQTLAELARQHSEIGPQSAVFSSIRHPREHKSDVAFLLQTVGELWMSGGSVDWKAFYCHENRQRVSLPSSPFDRQRYWMETGQSNERDANSSERNPKNADVGDWLYLPSWKRTLPPQLPTAEKLDNACRWLIFQDSWGLGKELEARLKELDQPVISITAGTAFAQVSECAYIINPDNHPDYDALLTSLQKYGDIPNRFVHLWNITPLSEQPSEKNLPNATMGTGFSSLMAVVQGIANLQRKTPIHITVVSNNVQEVTGEETLLPEKSPILGLCKVIPQEYPHIRCDNVDMVLSLTKNKHPQMVEQVFREMLHDHPDHVVAYRGNHRLVPVFETTRRDVQPPHVPRLQKKGVYLITGGLGGIGFELGEYLAKTLQATLILTQRSPFPLRTEWEVWQATHEDHDPTSQKICRIRDWETCGAHVRILRADVCNQQQMQNVVVHAQEEFGTINGVIHAAGLVDGVMLQERTQKDIENIVAPKMMGTLILDRVLQNIPLDFMVLCSSLTSILGLVGQAGNCAGNAFLDAFAYHKNSTGGPFITSINWDTWQEVGMTVNALSNLSKVLKTQGSHDESRQPLTLAQEDAMNPLKGGLLPSEGMEVFKRVLSYALPQVVVSTRNFPQRIQQSLFLQTNLFERSNQKTHQDNSSIARPSLTTTYVAPRSSTEETLAAIWQEVLHLEQVGIHDNIFHLGGDSILATQIMVRVRETFHLELPLQQFFESPTVEKLATLVQEYTL